MLPTTQQNHKGVLSHGRVSRAESDITIPYSKLSWSDKLIQTGFGILKQKRHLHRSSDFLF